MVENGPFQMVERVGVDHIHAWREDMLSAKRDDLKTIWDSLNPTPKVFFKSKYENECCWVVNEVVAGVLISAATEVQKEEEWMTLASWRRFWTEPH